MIVASLIATIRQNDMSVESAEDMLDQEEFEDGHASEANQYLMGKSASFGDCLHVQGEYKTILQLVTVLSHGKRMSPFSLYFPH